MTAEERDQVMVTIWTRQAIAELRKAYDYFSKDSPQNARKVVEELTAIADRLPAQPEIFPPDIRAGRLLHLPLTCAAKYRRRSPGMGIIVW